MLQDDVKTKNISTSHGNLHLLVDFGSQIREAGAVAWCLAPGCKGNRAKVKRHQNDNLATRPYVEFNDKHGPSLTCHHCQHTKSLLAEIGDDPLDFYEWVADKFN